jgi:hypothetical protein
MNWVQLERDHLKGIEKRRTFCDLGGEEPTKTTQEVRRESQDNLCGAEPEHRC